ncbi:serine protease [Reinekea forsetii]|nr:serine protease [Reinekea forsetii]
MNSFRAAIRWCFIVLLCQLAWVHAYTADEIFKEFRSRIYQIKVVDIESDSRTSIGSGFVVHNDTTVATNYHVVSAFVSKPEKYRVMIIPENGEPIAVKVVDFDIVNDLALLTSDVSLGTPIRIADEEPIQGTEIFAVGNPHDLGMTVVPGTYNGLADTAYYHRIHFSGSINPGMSGGPVFNASGELTGINVATSGNQVSFLVPAKKLTRFLANQEVILPEKMAERAQAQLLASQSKLLNDFLTYPRDIDTLGQAQVIGDVKGLVSCWGNSSRDEVDELLIVAVTKGCSLTDNIYINGGMTTGSLGYQFNWYDGQALSRAQFDHFLQGRLDWRADNRVTFKDVSAYQCHEDFTQINSNDSTSGIAKSFFCARQYTQFPELYDVLYFRLAKRDDFALVSHLTVSGVSQQSALAFLESFTEDVQWPQ